MKSSTSNRYEGLLVALGLGLLLLLVSFARIIGDSQSLLFHSKVLDSIFAGPIWGSALGYNLVFLAFAMVLVHTLFGVACWAISRASLLAWPALTATPKQHLLLW